MKKILVTGGAGYIGSIIVRNLEEKGYEPVIVDDMSSGHEDAVEGFELHKINLVTQKEKLTELFSKNKFDGVIHMAGFIQMGESYKNPQKYFKNNLVSSINLFDAMIEHGVSNIVFSSSAGVYGNPKSLPVTEDMEREPLNPYGETKYMIERMLEWMNTSHGINFVALRYFNAAGALMDGSIGENHPDESHLIAAAMTKALKGEEFTIFGDDYKTPDGTNVRDYIHVLDLSDLHVLALEQLMEGGESDYYNAGIGKGYSNKEVMEMIKEVTGLDFNVKYGERRKGDADELYASIDKIKKAFNWEPKYGLKEIIESAYKWHKNHPNGYEK